jgi:hypothetical protein
MNELPELDSSLPENDLGAMVSWIIVTCAVIALIMWSVK